MVIDRLYRLPQTAEWSVVNCAGRQRQLSDEEDGSDQLDIQSGGEENGTELQSLDGAWCQYLNNTLAFFSYKTNYV